MSLRRISISNLHASCGWTMEWEVSLYPRRGPIDFVESSLPHTTRLTKVMILFELGSGIPGQGSTRKVNNKSDFQAEDLKSRTGCSNRLSSKAEAIRPSRLLKKVIQRGRRRVTTGGVAVLTRPPRAALQLFPGSGTLRIVTNRERSWGPVSVACLEEGHAGVSDGRIELIGDPAVVA
jgi:hypothetical protein